MSTMRGFHSTEKAMTDDRETAHRWEPVGDLPLAACQVWRLKSDNNFELTVEGDFGTSERTLKIDFQGVVALAAHDDMLGLTKIRADTSIPLIGLWQASLLQVADPASGELALVAIDTWPDRRLYAFSAAQSRMHG
ncbi:hypothetical protein NKI32_18090 [Mesorhizobium sp. M0761]|uniref:hypothetical protein n=1 Tax=Mesorhizobium sp. M0761 TaxID=2956994 RepID=UPI0033397293